MKAPRTVRVADSALEVAEDAILRRARILDGQDPEIAEALRTLVTRLKPSMTVTNDEMRRHAGTGRTRAR